MPSVSIDASVVAVPDSLASPNDVRLYIEDLLSWSALLDEKWINLYMSERTVEILAEEGLYPVHNILHTLLRDNGITEFSTHDVSTVINWLLQSTPHFETQFGITDILSDHVSFTPNILGALSSPGMASNLVRSLLITAILQGWCQFPIPNHYVLYQAK